MTRVNSDDTYDIEYDDGDTERRVRKSLVRKLGGDSKRKSKSKYDDTEDDDEISKSRRSPLPWQIEVVQG